MTARVLLFYWIVSIFRHVLYFITEPKDSLFEDAAILYGTVLIDRAIKSILAKPWQYVLQV